MIGTRQPGSPELDKALLYEDQLLWVIQHYITQRSQINPKSRGVARGYELIDHINTQLLILEHLNSRQLQSRILTYILASSGSGKLESSNTLRKALLIHLCESLKVTEEEINKRFELLLLLDIKTALAMPIYIGMFYYPDEEEILMHALMVEAQVAMLKLPAFDSAKGNATLDAINNVLDAAVSHQGLEFVQRLKKYISCHWLMVDGLDERQMIWRMVEELETPLRPEFLDVNQLCRVQLLRALTECAECDEDVITNKLREITPPYSGRLSILGPIPRLFDSHKAEIEIRIDAIRKRLSIGYQPDCVQRTTITSSGESMELRIMRK